MSEASAAQAYFDPPDPSDDTCDICDGPQERENEDDWNGETGNHLSCEERRAQDDEEESYVRGSCPVCGGSVTFHASNCTELML